MVRKKIVKKISNFIGEQKASLHPIAIGLAAYGIYGVAHSSDLPSQPKTKANSVIFERSAPPGFKASADGGLDHALKFKKTLYRDIIFVQANDSKQGYILAPVALRSFQKLLLSIGLHEPAVEQLVRKVRWELGEEQCVALQEQPQNCVRLRLSKAEKQIVNGSAGDSTFEMVELIIDESTTKLRDEAVDGDLALSGGSYIYAGSSKTVASYGLGTWGIVSSGQKRAEYDFGVSHLSGQQGLLNPTKTKFNTLVLGTPYSGGMAFSGLFRAASGGQVFGAGSGSAVGFMSRPAQWGVAWQSDDSNLSDANVRRSVQVLLSSPSFVRILSEGQELFQGQLAAGEQKVEFSGFAGAFVDAEIRSASGQTLTRRLEVSRILSDKNDAIRTKTDTSFWYADIGNVVAAKPNALHNLGKTDVLQASLAYSYLAEDLVGQFALQSINKHFRVGLSAADRDRLLSASAVLGARGEKGLNASWRFSMSRMQGSLGFTEYRPPTKGFEVSGKCRKEQEAFCFSSNATGYSSRSVGFGLKDFPLRVGASWSRSDDEWMRLTTISSSKSLGSIWPGSFVTLDIQHNNRVKGAGIHVSIVAPLQPDSGGVAYMRSSVGGQSAGEAVSYSTSYSETIPQNVDSGNLIKSYSLSLEGELDLSASGRSPTLSANVESHLGVFQNTTNVTHNSRGGSSVNTAFATTYGISKEGIAFNPTNARNANAGSLSSSGNAGVVVHNRSQEAQYVTVDGRDNEIPPQSNVLIPVRAGYVDGIRVNPGPMQNLNASTDGQMLYKGNLKKVIVPEGFWVLARFKDVAVPRDAKVYLDVEFTFKRPGEAVERLYPSANGEASLFEFKENGDDIVRYVSAKGGTHEYRCIAKSADMPKPGSLAGYAEMQYLCTLIPSGILKVDSDSYAPHAQSLVDSVSLPISVAPEKLKDSTTGKAPKPDAVDLPVPSTKPNALTGEQADRDSISLYLKVKKWANDLQNRVLQSDSLKVHPAEAARRALQSTPEPAVLAIRDVQISMTTPDRAHIDFLMLVRVAGGVEWRKSSQNWSKSDQTWDMVSQAY